MAMVLLRSNALPRGIEYFGNTLGAALAFDQGRCRFCCRTQTGHRGLVDGNRGYHKASKPKPMMLAQRVRNLDVSYQFVPGTGIGPLNAPRFNKELGIRAPLFLGLKGHLIETSWVLK